MHPNAKDISGKRFGRLLVIKRAGTSRQREILWECLCDCGSTKNICASHLNGYRTLSCGCYQKEVTSIRAGGQISPARKPPGVAAFNRLMGNYKRSAKKRSLDWTLSQEQCRVLFQSPCHYCGAPPSTVCVPTGRKNVKHGGEFIFNGIDRKNNSLGYIPENSISCCSVCNYAKRDRDYDEFIDWIQRANANIQRAGIQCKHMQAWSLQKRAGQLGQTDKKTPSISAERAEELRKLALASCDINRDF